MTTRRGDPGVAQSPSRGDGEGWGAAAPRLYKRWHKRSPSLDLVGALPSGLDPPPQPLKHRLNDTSQRQLPESPDDPTLRALLRLLSCLSARCSGGGPPPLVSEDLRQLVDEGGGPPSEVAEATSAMRERLERASSAPRLAQKAQRGLKRRARSCSNSSPRRVCVNVDWWGVV